jgi:hypothetical protein
MGRNSFIWMASHRHGNWQLTAPNRIAVPLQNTLATVPEHGKTVVSRLLTSLTPRTSACVDCTVQLATNVATHFSNQITPFILNARFLFLLILTSHFYTLTVYSFLPNYMFRTHTSTHYETHSSKHISTHQAVLTIFIRFNFPKTSYLVQPKMLSLIETTSRNIDEYTTVPVQWLRTCTRALWWPHWAGTCSSKETCGMWVININKNQHTGMIDYILDSFNSLNSFRCPSHNQFLSFLAFLSVNVL